MSKFFVSWQETYEMSSIIEASTLEEVLATAAKLMDDTPSFEFMDEWQSGPEGSPVTMCQGETVGAECLSSIGPFCMPYIERNMEDDQKGNVVDDDTLTLSAIPWPSEEEPIARGDGSH